MGEIPMKGNDMEKMTFLHIWITDPKWMWRAMVRDAWHMVDMKRGWGKGAPDDMLGKARERMLLLRMLGKDAARMMKADCKTIKDMMMGYMKNNMAGLKNPKIPTARLRGNEMTIGNGGHKMPETPNGKAENTGGVVFWALFFLLAAVAYGVAQPIMNGEVTYWSAMWLAMGAMFVCKLVGKIIRNERQRKGWS